MASATSEEIRVGSTSTKLSDLVNRGAAFDDLYVFPPLLDACCRVIGGPFKLSSLHARTLRPRTTAQELHVDVPRHSGDWPLLGFIVMIDEFRPDNGATRFIPGSHRWPGSPADTPLRRTGCVRRRGVGVRPRRLTARLQRVRMARPYREHVERAAPIDSGRIHTARRVCRARLRGPHAPRDAPAAQPPRTARPRTLTGAFIWDRRVTVPGVATLPLCRWGEAHGGTA